MNETISFKSNPENYAKESIDSKNNTIRRLEDTDKRKQIADNYLLNKYDKLYIEIVNSKDQTQKISRRIRDITIWEGIYVFTWWEYGVEQPEEKI